MPPASSHTEPVRPTPLLALVCAAIVVLEDQAGAALGADAKLGEVPFSFAARIPRRSARWCRRSGGRPPRASCPPRRGATRARAPPAGTEHPARDQTPGRAATPRAARNVQPDKISFQIFRFLTCPSFAVRCCARDDVVVGAGMQQRDRCRGCHGEGESPNRGDGLCGECAGTGRMPFFGEDRAKAMGVSNACPACNGTRVCQRCDGSGYAPLHPPHSPSPRST